MRLRYNCIINKLNHNETCLRHFNSEYNLIAHVLFEHEVLMPICSTGIDEKIFKDNMELIKEFRAERKILTYQKTQLKRRFLKSLYGRKKVNMDDMNQDTIFRQNLDNYHNKLFTRLIYVNHGSYDLSYSRITMLLKKIESKGLILS